MAPDDRTVAQLADPSVDPRHELVRLTGGDLHRTVGGRPGDSAGSGTGGGDAGGATILPVDLGLASIDGGPETAFCAHLVAHEKPWGGRIVAVMNAQWIGSLNIVPAGHPNDGRLDVIDADLPRGQRWKAFRRLRTGTHLPHPDIGTRRVKTLTLDFERPMLLRLDGRSVGRATRVEARCVPDALEIAL